MNKEIELLNNKLKAQDKIINTQALEIARLKEQLTMLVQDDERDQEIIIKLGNRIDKAIEYICNVLCNKTQVRNDISGKEIDKLLGILGDKENGK